MIIGDNINNNLSMIYNSENRNQVAFCNGISNAGMEVV